MERKNKRNNSAARGNIDNRGSVGGRKQDGADSFFSAIEQRVMDALGSRNNVLLEQHSYYI